MALEFKAPETIILKPIIVVFGVGGAGGNAVNNMLRARLQGAKFVVANTDAQALSHSECENKIQLGINCTKGLGAGASPEVGKEAAIESESEIKSYLEGSNMVFITAGMGGGTGTGAAPVIARIASELGILTVGVVTKPFLFEGAKRMKAAESGLEELQQYVDTLIVIPNQNLFRIANETTTFTDAFKMADEVLHSGVRGVTDLITMPGLINLDFADIKTVMSEMGKAMMGTGEASGEDRAVRAAEAAIANPLLDHTSMSGAKGVLINITGGKDMTLYEVDSAANRIREEVGDTDANIIFGSTFNSELEGTIRVSVVATGIDLESGNSAIRSQHSTKAVNKKEEKESEIVFEEFSTEIEEIPLYDDNKKDFDAYLNDEDSFQEKLNHIANQSDLQYQDTQQFAHLNQPLMPIAPERLSQQGVSPKQSLFKRMWNSLKAAEASDHPREERRDVSSVNHKGKSEIQDIPAFLRKNR